MNEAMSVAIWVSVAFCVIGIVMISCWLLLDWQREVNQARAIARMVREYGGGAITEDAWLVEATEYTWPIVAQQPQKFYSKAITVPIPRSVVKVVLPTPRVEHEESADLHWPPVDVDTPQRQG
jgi:hypothetical protein